MLKLVFPALLLAAMPAHAGVNDILIGLDQKVTYGPDGPVNGAPGKDEILVLDVATPAKPTIRARLTLMNSLLGPPTNLQITPDGKWGLVANAVLHTPDIEGFKVSPDERLFVIDLTATPPRLADTLIVGKQPSGLAIARKGDLALVANRFGKSVSVLTIANGKVSVKAEVPVEQEAAAVAILPDGTRAFVVMNSVDRVGVLTIDGQKVTYDKSLDIPVGVNPYNIDITPNGRFAIVSATGPGKNHASAIALIDTAGAHPRVANIVSPGAGPEGFAISPDGKWVAVALLAGSAAKQSDWFRTDGGELVLMALDQNKGEMTVESRTPIGRLPDAIAFAPKGDAIYVGNYIDATLQVFRFPNGRLAQVGTPVKLGGQPASMRGLAR